MRKLEKHEIPNQLFEIPEPPKELWIEGDFLFTDDVVYLTIVGSRKHSNYGRDACRELIIGLSGYPIVIVSGLAIGIDTIAHETALKVGLKTLAFPGSGLLNTVLYPRSNWQLANEIIKNGGAILSELSPETKAAQWTFPRRNRIMAGLAHAVLIVEAEEKSGTLITARLAMDYNKDVLVVPGSIFSDNSKGTNRFIKEGAHPVTSSEDILFALGFDPIENTSLSNSLSQSIDLNPHQRSILDLLKDGPLQKNTLVELLPYDTQQVNIELSEMELLDLISEEGGVLRKK